MSVNFGVIFDESNAIRHMEDGLFHLIERVTPPANGSNGTFRVIAVATDMESLNPRAVASGKGDRPVILVQRTRKFIMAPPVRGLSSIGEEFGRLDSGHFL